ncbi:unnamed protein product [Phytophthora lilii]|uniref:Unnamed protein product n=1 Tax=Phytophthora lilii TaxID=2077276 RepID=A0A9W6THH1_9STRA|nr:unnamed protein product [Phytophthora lilii]
MPGKRSRHQGGAPAKKARVHRAKPPLQVLPRLKDVQFPPSIAARAHVLQLVDEFLMSPKEAVVAAAEEGNADEIRRLASTLFLHDRDGAIADLYTWDALAKAINAASSHGCVAVLKLLMKEVFKAMRSWNSTLPAWDIAGRAFSEAAANGCLNVVKYLIRLAEDKGYNGRIEAFDALARAICGGDKHVVELLMERAGSQSELEKAFVAAIEVYQPYCAEKIREKYAGFETDLNLFTRLALTEKLNAVKYLYDTDVTMLSWSGTLLSILRSCQEYLQT